MAETFVVIISILLLLGCISVFMSFIADKAHPYDLLPTNKNLSEQSSDLIISDHLLE